MPEHFDLIQRVVEHGFSSLSGYEQKRLIDTYFSSRDPSRNYMDCMSVEEDCRVLHYIWSA